MHEKMLAVKTLPDNIHPMSAVHHDLVDDVIDDVRSLYPTLDVGGLPIVGRILRLAQLLQARRDAQLARFGLSVADFDVLASLRRRSSASAVNVRDLHHAMLLSSGGMTKRLDRLEAAGLLARRPDPADRRGVLIELTPAGLAVIDEAIPAITESETAMVRSTITNERARSQVEAALRQLLLAQASPDAE
jgi:DNA-binding MarR family transcriptional regulator